jgi:membrane-associated phospholipid phosphatase
VFAGILTCIFFPKPELHIFFNELNSPTGDVFFKIMTNLGDGLVYLVVLIILLFIRYRLALVFFVGVVISNVIVHISKSLIWTHAYRPSKYFELFESYKLHFVEGVNLHALHSFPSGHSTTVFNVFFMLALVVKNNFIKFTFLIIAILGAYSRVYLSQHFLIDIVCGAILGVGCIIIAWKLIYPSEKEWLNNSLLSKKNK